MSVYKLCIKTAKVTCILVTEALFFVWSNLKFPQKIITGTQKKQTSNWKFDKQLIYGSFTGDD